jgi:hypothetical protein
LAFDLGHLSFAPTLRALPPPVVNTAIVEPNSDNSDKSIPPENAQVQPPQPEPAIFNVANAGLSGV